MLEKLIKIKPSRELISKFTCNGLIFYQLKIKGLQKINENRCKNVRSPFRRDRKPSFSVSRNQSNNTWYFKDFGDSSFTGDVFDFAALVYGLSTQENFQEIIEKMWIDLKIDNYEPYSEIIEMSKSYDFNLNWNKLLGRDSNFVYEDYKEENDTQKLIRLTFEESDYNNLNPLAQQFLNTYGITVEALKNNNSCFINSYECVYDNGGYETTDFKSRPDGEVWLAYKFHGFAKIYCPKPKKFRFVGKKTQEYYFGSDCPTFSEDADFPLLIVGGEKDVLTLESRGFNACCFNSESASIPHVAYKNWWDAAAQGYGEFKKVFIYDRDDTGIKQMKKLSQQSGFNYILLPDWLKEKGAKDISDFFMLGGTIEEFRQLILGQQKSWDKDSVIATAQPLLEQPSVTSVEIRGSIRTAKQRIEDARFQADILPLFGVFLQNNELVIFFGDTGKGKSIIAVSIANAISKGEKFLGMDNGYPALKVLYFDFELSDKQFQKRCSNSEGEPYQFSDYFFIDNLDFSTIIPKDKSERFEEKLMGLIKQGIKDTAASVLILDNITYLSTNTAEDTEVAMRLMKMLKDLKAETGITILVLAHTPKKTNPSGISIQDLAGSKHISNFADGVFAIGQSNKDKDLRYLKQIKPSRSAELIYDAENVLVCEIEKLDSFLTFTHKGYAKEIELLGINAPEVEEELRDEAIKLKVGGKTYREIAEILKVSKSKVGRWLKE